MSRKKYRDFEDEELDEEVDVNEFVENEEYDGYVLEDEADVKELNFED